jgi:methyl-accepting chemotaxis protein
MKLLNKVLVAPVVTVLLMLTLAALSYMAMHSQERALQQLFDGRFQHSAVATAMRSDVLKVHSRAYRVLTWSASRGDGYIEKETKTLLAEFDSDAAKFSAWASGPNLSDEEAVLATKMVAQIVQYRKSIASALDMATADINAGTMAMQSADDNFQQLSESAQKLVTLEEQLGKGDVNQSAAVFKRMLATGVVLLLVSIGVAAAISIYMAHSIKGQVGGEPADVSVITQQISQGDLSAAISLHTDDQSSLLHAIKTMRDSLAAIVANVRQSSEGVATASAEIAQGNHDLSARTEQQAGSIEKTTASMHELDATVKQNADSARQANQLASHASTVATSGGQVVSQVVETMRGINESSRRISDIISVIDGIAFQTNILALNAAVEAARAGEQGRGFAVVASEVRSLAGRSAEAAKEIKSLINASVERVEQGTNLVDRAGVTMTEVVDAIRRVTDIMGEISSASNEQALGVSEVGEAITQMDQSTQQNAALVEEMAAAASSLTNQAQELVQVVAVFKLGSTPLRIGQ